MIHCNSRDMQKEHETQVENDCESACESTEQYPVCCEPQTHIEISNLSLSYAHTTALSAVSMCINKGCISTIVGPSGCGKSSFLSTINRLSDLIPQCIVSGSIRIDNAEILESGCDLIALRRRVGMIFQKPNPFPFSIHKNMMFPLWEHGMRDRQQIDHCIEQALRDVGLWNEVKDRLNTQALSLSGGQQQRLCLARTLALKPDILLLDEPCSALDPMASAVVEDLITSLRGRYTVLVVTHNLAQARRIADHVAVFWVQDGSGKLIESGSAQEIFESPQHQLTQAYISGLRG